MTGNPETATPDLDALVERLRSKAMSRAAAYSVEAARTIEWEAAAAILSLRAERDAPLPCDVHLPPNTYIRKGCKLSTALLAISKRNGWSDEQSTFARALKKEAENG